MFVALATLPSSSDFLASIGAWSGDIFTALLPFAIYAIGVILGFFLIRFLVQIISGALHRGD
jgi:hypothetical protein